MNLANSRSGWRLLPILVIVGIIFMLWKGLGVKEQRDSFNKEPFPQFTLNDLRDNKAMTLADLKGKINIVHVWASWCSVCIKEHQEWVKIKKDLPHSLVGIAYRDDQQALQWVLNKKGDPYTHLLHDVSGTLGLELGINGVPETFIVDQNGVIRYHHMGTLSADDFRKTVLPVLDELKKEQG